MLLRALFFILIVTPYALAAQEVEYFRVQSGSGFFVNRDYIVTNAHVVKGCTRVFVKGAVKEHEVSVKEVDAEHDLAILQTDQPPDEFASLRFNIDDLKVGDKVMVIGYPGEEGVKGEYKVASSEVIQPAEKSMNIPGQFFITDVLAHGNSGGPVLDTSGNVIGVVVAKTVIYTINPVTNEKISEEHAGVVISLATLKQFLFDHGVFAQWMGSGLLMFPDAQIEQRAKATIVNVQCRKPTDAAGNLLNPEPNP